MGLIGIRERVMALGGTLDVIDLGDKGFKLHAMIRSRRRRKRRNEPEEQSASFLSTTMPSFARATARFWRSTKGSRSSARPATPRRPIKATRIRGRMSSSWISRCRAAAALTRSSISESSTPMRASSCSRCTPGPRTRCTLFGPAPKGYVTKSSPPDLLVRAVRDVAEGRLAICPEISEALAFDRVQEEKTRLQDFRRASSKSLRMIIGAKSTDEIASALNVSRKTVANYHYGSSRSSAWIPISSCSISVSGKVWSGPFPRRPSAGARPKHAIAPARAIFPGFPRQVSIFPSSGKRQSPSRI